MRTLRAKKPLMVADVHVKCDSALKELFAEKMALQKRVERLEMILREVRSRAIGFSDYIHNRVDDA